MSERLTEEELARLFLIADTHSGGITMSRDNARRLLLELKARRAADLSPQEKEAIKWLRHDADQIMGPHDGGACRCPSCERHRRALAILDKLIGGKA